MNVRVHAVCSQPQFYRHVRPVYEALPQDLRGGVIRDPRGRTGDLPADDIILVGGFGNIASARGRRVVYVEHGAGQTYSDLRPKVRGNYPGGIHTPNVIGYISPNPHVADLWDRPSVVVGCPAVDDLHVGLVNNVVITFHWDAVLVSPEARSAHPHYLEHLHEIIQWVRESTWLKPLGHWHPRDIKARVWWEHLGVETEADPDRALEGAALVIADNTSFGYEAALLGIPNIALNAPWYRRDVDHGLRFWDHPPGLMVDDADQLMSRPVEAWIDDPVNRTIRDAAARRAYGLPHGGGGAVVGAKFISDLVG